MVGLVARYDRIGQSVSLDLAGDAEGFGHFLVGFSVVGLVDRVLSCVLDRAMNFKKCGQRQQVDSEH